MCHLTLLLIVTRRFILQKARRQTSRSYRPPTACRQPVSGSISLPSRGAFHLSLTVLVHYRWQRVFSLRRWSSGIHPGFLVSRVTRVASAESDACHLRDCHPLWLTFPCHSVIHRLCNSHVKDPTTPQRKTSAVWAVSPSLAATDEIDFSFFSTGY